VFSLWDPRINKTLMMNLPCTKAMLVQVVYGLSAVVTFSLCAFVLDGSLFAWHPTFMSVGFLGLMTLGIVRSITFRKLDGKARVKAIQIHALIQAVASSCIFAGLGCIVRNKVARLCLSPGPACSSVVTSLLILAKVMMTHVLQVLHNKPHLTSVHAKVRALHLSAEVYKACENPAYKNCTQRRARQCCTVRHTDFFDGNHSSYWGHVSVQEVGVHSYVP